MTGDLLKCNVLATHTIANVSETLARKLELPERYRSIGILTADSDDVTYCALDEATKAAAVEVVYGRSLYAGAANANTKLAGEVIGILAGPNPAEVNSGLRAAVGFMDSGVGFRSANEDDSIVYFAHTVSRTGSYLSKTAGVKEGEALAYLIAPPLEAVVGLDEALKASDVELVALFEPPSETNFGGGLLTGSAQYAYDSGPMMYVYGIVGSGGGLYGDLNYTADTCRQCKEPQCMNVCPIGAITWQQKEGCITVDHKRCIGCSACTTACPWMMATVNTESKKSSKCVLCGECANACPTGALKIIEWKDITV